MRLLAIAALALAGSTLAPTNSPRANATHGVAVRFDRTIAADVDGIVVRGRVRARVGIGTPLVRIDGGDAATPHVTLHASTLTFERTSLPGDARVPTLTVHVRHLRGVATSGDVDLIVDDRSDRPIFLDLAGAGDALLRGAVPLVRTTVSGTETADFSGLRATEFRVHARQWSRASFVSYVRLTIVAVDDAKVGYRGPAPVRVTRRGRATVRRDE